MDIFSKYEQRTSYHNRLKDFRHVYIILTSLINISELFCLLEAMGNAGVSENPDDQKRNVFYNVA